MNDQYFESDELLRRASRSLQGRYEIRSALFDTLTGVHCEGFDKIEDRKITIRLFPELITADRQCLDSLRHEVKTALRLSHANVGRVFSLEVSGDLAFVRLEPLRGRPLTDLLGSVPPAPRLGKIYEQALDALLYAHGKGVAHGDLRPDALLIDPDDRLKLLDFGVARVANQTLTRITGKILREASLYSAPEVIRGDEHGAASDYYSLGCVLYELLAQNPPFFSGDLAQQHIHETPEALPAHTRRQHGEISKFVSIALAKDPCQRLEEVQEILAGRMTAGGLSGARLIQGRAARGRSFGRSWPSRLAWAGVLALLAFGLGAASVQLRETLHDRRLIRDLGLEFREVYRGEFSMGEAAGDDDNPAHIVAIRHDYEFGYKEVSLGQYLLFLNDVGETEALRSLPSRARRAENGFVAHGSSDDLPVVGVSWSAAVAFCRWLSRIDGDWVYRLPTEAEWERAARGPFSGKRFPWGESAPDAVGPLVQCDPAGDDPVPVGEEGHRQSAVGYHLLGNAAEWVSDFYDPTFYRTPRAGLDPTGPVSGVDHVVRGGSFADPPESCRVGARRMGSDYPPEQIGFRLVRVRP